MQYGTPREKQRRCHWRVGHFRISSVDVGVDPEGNPVTSCVVDWIEEPPRQLQRSQLPKSTRRALYELESLINNGIGRRLESGSGVPPAATAISVDEWRAACRRAPLSTGREDAERKAIQRARQTLLDAKIVGEHNSFVWLNTPDQSAGRYMRSQISPKDSEIIGTTLGHRSDMSRT
jgi:hypothetical protein